MDEVLQATTLKRLFRKNLVAVRKEKGWSQSELARRAGVPASYICALEAGTKSPLLSTIAKLAETLDVRPGDLLCADPDREKISA